MNTVLHPRHQRVRLLVSSYQEDLISFCGSEPLDFGGVRALRLAVKRSPGSGAAKEEILEELVEYERDLVSIQEAHTKATHLLEREQLIQEATITKWARPIRAYFWLGFLLLCYPVSWFVSHDFVPLPSELLIGILIDLGLYTWKRSEEKMGRVFNPFKRIFNKS